MAHRRVVITGLGIIAPNGIGKDEYWRSLVHGRSAVDRVFSFDASPFPCRVAAEVRDFSPADFTSGKLTIALAGGSDAPIVPETFAAFCAVGGLTRENAEPRRASRPYDKTRDGIVLGEGGATLVLEELESAVARGARIYAEVRGHGAGHDAGSAIEAALREADVAPDDIDHINAHGCGLPGHDVGETNAFKRAFGPRAYHIPITSIKSMIGEPLAAGGVLQTAAGGLSIRDQCVPPTINQHEPDPECDLDYVPNRSRIAPVTRALINSQGAGGRHAALVIARHD